MTPRQYCNRPCRRRGVLYVHVMLISLLVSLIAITSLRTLRSQARELQMVDQLSDAKTNSRFAVQVAVAEMQRDPRWRQNIGGGSWASDQAIAGGRYSISVGPNDPLLLSGDLRDDVTIQVHGNQEAASYQTHVKIQSRPAQSTCLEVALMSTKKTEFKSSHIYCSGLIGSNDEVKASDSIVAGDVESGVAINGDGFLGTQTANVAIRTMPDPSTVFDYYLAAGTYISAASLPSFQAPEMLPNTNFEQNLDYWRRVGDFCELERSGSEVRSGLFSLLVKNRDSTNSSAAQIMETGQGGIDQFISGHEYRLTIPTRPVDDEDCRAICILEDSEGKQHTFGDKEKWTKILKDHIPNNGFQNVSIEFKPKFDGVVVRCEVRVEFKKEKKDYNLDDASLVDITFPAGTKSIESIALTPSHNPYGSTNAQGIYIIDCGGADVLIRSARIEGTVLLRNPGKLSGVYGPVAWRTLVGGQPALMSDYSLVIAMTDRALNESELNVNFNPPSAPWPQVGGVSNTTNNDCYGSQISGLIYAAKDIDINGVLNLRGSCIADNKLKAEGAVVRVNYDAAAAMNPPPGFDLGSRPLSFVSGSWRHGID